VQFGVKTPQCTCTALCACVNRSCCTAGLLLLATCLVSVVADRAAPKAARSEYESFLTAVAGLLGGDLPSQELQEAAEQVRMRGWGSWWWRWGCGGWVQQQCAA
jgi:hypothetical protein